MRIIENLDEFIFIKNNYSILKHLVPFSIAALLLIILSVPDENMMIKFAKLLQHPSFLWVPAIILTLTAIVVYYFAIRTQIQKAYLWDFGIKRRSKLTAAMYIVICSIMAYAVLYLSPPSTNFLGGILASLLIAVLSLTGIGWSTPAMWVELIGVKCPDYTEAQDSANRIKKILIQMRKSSEPVTETQIDDFIQSAKNLKNSIGINLEFEPKGWLVSKKIDDAMQAIDHLIKSVENGNFKKEPEEFRVACRYKSITIHSHTIESLQKAEQFWQEWKNQ